MNWIFPPVIRARSGRMREPETLYFNLIGAGEDQVATYRLESSEVDTRINLRWRNSCLIPEDGSIREFEYRDFLPAGIRFHHSFPNDYPVIHDEPHCRLCKTLADPNTECREKKRRHDEWHRKNEAKKWTRERAINIFSYRPRPGDIWEVRVPGKSKKIKTVDDIRNIECRTGEYPDQRIIRVPWVDWERMNKGRYTGIRVKVLLKHGRLIERDPEAK